MLEFILNFLADGLVHASWLAKVIYFIVVTQLTILSVTLYLHRSQAHRGVDFIRCSRICSVSGRGSARAWSPRNG